MLCFLYILLIAFSIVGLLGFLSFIKILKIWQKPICIPYLLVSLVAVIFIGVYTSFLGNIGDIFDISNMSESDRRGALGTLGDYFGGMLNPILAFLSFTVLVAALVYQSKQLEQNEKALEETRKAIQQNEKALEQNASALKINNTELANSTKQLALATDAHKEIEKTQKLQQFENSFYQLFNQLNDLQDKLISDREGEIEKILKDDFTLHNAREAILENRFISRYFMLLYQLLKLIDVTINLSSDGEKFRERRKFYTNLIRSQQDVRMLRLLFINCYKDFPKYKQYLESANFFEHMPFGEKSNYSFHLLACLKFYVNNIEIKSDLFDKSYYGNLKESSLLEKVFKLSQSELEQTSKTQFIRDLLSNIKLESEESLNSLTDYIWVIEFEIKNFDDLKFKVNVDKSVRLKLHNNKIQRHSVLKWELDVISLQGFGINVKSKEDEMNIFNRISINIFFNFSENLVNFNFRIEQENFEYSFRLSND